MTFRTTAFDGFSPHLVARLLRGVCADVDDDHVVLTFAGTQKRLDALATVLEPFTPTDTHVVEMAQAAPAVPVHQELVLEHA